MPISARASPSVLRWKGLRWSAETGTSGFRAFLRERPDVIVCDLWMPDGTGYQFIKSVRGLPPEAGGLTPAIAISANMQAALLAGCHVFIRKPFDLITLVDTIANFARPDGCQASAP